MRGATERRAFATELPIAVCIERLEAVTWIETGENVAVVWPMPQGKTVYGWISSDGFMVSPASTSASAWISPGAAGSNATA